MSYIVEKYNQYSIPTCPVTFQPIEDPVLVDCQCGGSVGYEAFAQWVQVYLPEDGGMPICPCCGETLISLDSRPNHSLTYDILRYSKQRSQPSRTDEHIQQTSDCSIIGSDELSCNNRRVEQHKRSYSLAKKPTQNSCVKTTYKHETTISRMGDYVTFCTPLDDQRVVCGSANGRVQIYNIDTGLCEAVLTGHTDWIESCVVLPDRRRLVTASRDKTLRIWNLFTGECIHILASHRKGVSCCAVLGPCRIVNGSYDKTLKIWNVDVGVCEKTIQGPTRVLCCAVLSSDHHNTASSKNTNGHKTIVSGDVDGILRVWDTATGTCRRQLAGHQGSIKCCCVLFDDDGRYLRVVTGGEDRTLKVWNLGTGHCEATLEGHSDWVLSMAALDSSTSTNHNYGDGKKRGRGQQLLSSSGDHTLKIWNLNDVDNDDTGHSFDGAVRVHCQQTLAGHSWIVPSCSSMGFGRFVSCSYDRTVRVWVAC